MIHKGSFCIAIVGFLQDLLVEADVPEPEVVTAHQKDFVRLISDQYLTDNRLSEGRLYKRAHNHALPPEIVDP